MAKELRSWEEERAQSQGCGSLGQVHMLQEGTTALSKGPPKDQAGGRCCCREPCRNEIF